MNPLSPRSGVPLDLSPEQWQWLRNTSQFLKEETGSEVSDRSILLRLMALGLPAFEQEMHGMRARSNAKQKRFPRLQLVYTQVQSPGTEQAAPRPGKSFKA